MGIFTTKPITFISSQIVNISNLISTYIISKTIKFNLTNIKNPFFSSNTVTIKLTVVTNDGYLRTTGSYNLQITPGIMTINTFTCTTYQIGYKSSCKLNFTTSNSINVNSSISLTFPTQNWMTSYSGTNTICTVLSSSSLPQVKSIFQCRYNDFSKSFVFTQFTNDLTNVTTINPFTAMVYI